MGDLTVAVGQAPPVCGNVDANVSTACELLAEAARAGASLLVLPELFLCGYDIEAIARDPQRHTVDLDGPEFSRIGTACREHRISVVIGASIRTPSGSANAAAAVSSEGRILGAYEKTHLWNREQGVFVSGMELLAIDADGFQLGLGICYDAGFPEFCRAHVLAGADALVFVSAFGEGDERRRYDMYHPMRALENTVYVIVANASGPQGGVLFPGRSAVFDPSGIALARIDEPRGIAVTTLRSEELAHARAALPYLQDRRDPLPPVRLVKDHR